MNMAEQAMIRTPDVPAPESFTDPKAAVVRLQELYDTAVRFLSDGFSKALREGQPASRMRAYYPEIRLTTTTYAKMDSRLAFGHVAHPTVDPLFQ